MPLAYLTPLSRPPLKCGGYELVSLPTELCLAGRAAGTAQPCCRTFLYPRGTELKSRGQHPGEPTCSTYSESASGCFSHDTMRPTRMSILVTSGAAAAAGAAAQHRAIGHWVWRE